MSLGRTAARLLATATRTFATASAATRARPASAAVAEELELLEHDLHAAALFLRVLVLPLVEAQAPFDVQRAAFGHILGDRLALFAPRLDVDEGRLRLD